MSNERFLFVVRHGLNVNNLELSPAGVHQVRNILAFLQRYHQEKSLRMVEAEYGVLSLSGQLRDIQSAEILAAGDLLYRCHDVLIGDRRDIQWHWSRQELLRVVDQIKTMINRGIRFVVLVSNGVSGSMVAERFCAELWGEGSYFELPTLAHGEGHLISLSTREIQHVTQSNMC